jgi:DNA uptake protein ComE-like DNA-binding protein
MSEQAVVSNRTAREGGTLDLNRATAEELDKLPGAARIGKAIVRGRPYSAPDDLVRKRILTKEAFARIKDQIAVSP